jgi:hypothetical protein
MISVSLKPWLLNPAISSLRDSMLNEKASSIFWLGLNAQRVCRRFLFISTISLDWRIGFLSGTAF